MRIVVTGAGGFIGWHLVDALASRGETVQAWVREPRADSWQTKVEQAAVDVADRDAVAKALTGFMPDAVFHLAAKSLPGKSWEDPAATYRVNVGGAINLLEAARALKKPPRVLMAGSSAEYAEPPDERLISEDAAVEPNSPYASSKLAADHLTQLYGRRYGLDLIRFRPFYLIGPRKTGDVCSDFARRIVRIERGSEPVMRVGVLDVVRDVIDVRDGVDGIALVVKSGKSGEMYNICGSGRISIREILETLRANATVKFDVQQDPQLIRPLEQRSKIGDSAKLRSLGWAPKHKIEETLRGILDYWRQQKVV